MQTFLPVPDFDESAAILDYRRLGKQRVEAYQLLTAKPGTGWFNHPAAKMWRSHHSALALYGIAMCNEWIRRGYNDTLRPRISGFLDRYAIVPPWFGDPAFHAAHRSNLLRKDPAYYGQFGWTEPPDLPYIWGYT